MNKTWTWILIGAAVLAVWYFMKQKQGVSGALTGAAGGLTTGTTSVTAP